MTKIERDPLAQIRSQTAAIIPAYQDEKHIGDIVRRVRQQLDHVLVVDDGSTDQTAQRAREAGAEVIVHSENRGKGEAIKTGLGHWFAAASLLTGGFDREVVWGSFSIPTANIFPKKLIGLFRPRLRDAPTFFLGNRMNMLPACRLSGAS